MSQALLPFYERERARLGMLMREFGEQYPQLASSLGVVDGACEDPAVGRIIEAMALLGARILQQLEDSYPQFSDALLSVNYPQFTRPFPSCSIARFDLSQSEVGAMSTPTVVERGARLHAGEVDGIACTFQSAYAVLLAPLQVRVLRFATVPDAPPGMRLPAGTSSLLHISIASVSTAFTLDKLGQHKLRVFIEGDPVLRAQLRDAIFLRTLCTYLERRPGAPWLALGQSPFSPAGFGDDDGLTPACAGTHPGYRLLMEYFVFPEKFNFIDMDVASLVAHLPPGALAFDLHLAVSGVRADSDVARTMQDLSPANFLLFCTPVVNLFARAAVPVDISHAVTDYPLLACAEKPAAYDIHSVDAVRVVRDTPGGGVVTAFHPYYAMRHGQAFARKGHYWSIRRDETLAAISPGHEVRLALVDADFDPLALESTTVSADLTCTNRNLPVQLTVGGVNGDLRLERAAGAFCIRLLRKPTASVRFAAQSQWRLIAHLSLNHKSLVQEQLPAFIDMLSLYNMGQSAAVQAQIRAIVGLSHRPLRLWLDDDAGGARVSGVEVRITLDDAAFAGCSLHVFAEVIDHFLGLYVHINSFIQLLVVAKSNEQELIRCKPRSGHAILV